jgi:hypothetical protein
VADTVSIRLQALPDLGNSYLPKYMVRVELWATELSKLMVNHISRSPVEIHITFNVFEPFL